MYTIPDAKNQALFNMAYREYGQELIRHARSMIDSREVSEDVVQDAFVRMWIYLVRGGKVIKMRAFLHHVLNNVIVDLYRKHKSLSLDVLVDQGKEPSIDESERLFDILDGRSAFMLIDRLPSTYQKVLRLKYGSGMSYQEISRETGQSKNTTAVQVHRGLEKLKTLYEHA